MVTIHAPKSITISSGVEFTLFVAVTSNSSPVTDANMEAILYDENGVVETSISKHIANGIYAFDFMDKETAYGMIHVAGINYDIHAYVHLTRVDKSPDIILTRKILSNNWEIKNNQLIIYDDDGVTELAKFDLYDRLGNPAEINIFKRVRRD